MTELSEYDYDLPRELIAQHALACRSDARLLVVSRRHRSLTHSHVRNVAEFLQPGDCLVLNDTRVLAARLQGYRTKTRGRWSGLFLTADAEGRWEVMSRTRGRLHPGDSVMLQDREARDAFCLHFMADLGDGLWVVQPEDRGSPVDVLQRIGRVPLPPYIRGGEMEEGDLDRYQTVYAQRAGAIAAPTAGLHFTTELLDRLVASGMALCRVTLHVGVGTFRPITAERLEEHQMHSEWGEITPAAVEQLRACRRAGGRIVAVGTTCVRVLETASQGGELTPWQGSTELFIRPPFTFRAIDALLTNFHLPKSTLLVLIRTFGGDELMKRAYQEAIDERYRFFSYGDAMLIL